MRIAILDDYQSVALTMADWSPLEGRAEISVFTANHPFRTLDNVLATPHLGYVTESLYRTLYGDTVRNIVDWLDRRPGD